MPRKKAEIKVEVEKTSPKVATKTEVSVFDGTVLVRTYSKAVHGDNFEALAKQFVSDRPTYSLK